MAQASGVKKSKKKVYNKLDIATFYVGKALCGINIQDIQELNRPISMSNVPGTPDYVLGIINLRGRIVTIIDLGKKIGLEPVVLTPESRNIIVQFHDEYISLLVDRIADILIVDEKEIAAPPSNLKGAQGRYFEGVYKAEKDLMAILDIEEVLKVGNDAGRDGK